MYCVVVGTLYKMKHIPSSTTTLLFLLHSTLLQTVVGRLPRLSAWSFAISQPYSLFHKLRDSDKIRRIKVNRNRCVLLPPSSAVTDETTDSSDVSSYGPSEEEILVQSMRLNGINNSTDDPSLSLMDLMIYCDPSHKSCTMWGLNVKRSKFDAYVNYTLQMRGGDVQVAFNKNFVNNYCIADNEDNRSWLRQVWKDSRLITEKTDILAIYRSDLLPESNRSCSEHTQSFGIRRGGFSDMIAVYTDRMISIIKEECTEEKSSFLINWLEKEYGLESTSRLQAAVLLKNSRDDQVRELQSFLDCFRAKFPYYHDRCVHCGMSTKDQAEASIEAEDDTHFVGYVYPSNEERLGKAARTEIYLCKHCHGFTRFPRFNSVENIIRNGRGRCGEYAMLLYRILKTLGHDARWVVDWSDHVWVEILLPNESNGSKKEWIHLDPCEAAVDKPLLYQEWGKNQTYIMAFHGSKELQRDVYPAIEDVTPRYTTDISGIFTRREEPSSFIGATLRSQIERLERETS